MHPYIEQQVLLDVLLAHQGSVEAALTSLKSSDSPPRKASAATGYQSSLSSFIAKTDASEGLAKRAKILSKRGKTLHLYDPADVATHAPCSIIHNFLPAEEANALLEELLKEAPSFERMTFKLFDNVVQSPHTACFYVHSHAEVQSQKTEYLYNGALLTVGVFTFFPSFRYDCWISEPYYLRIRFHCSDSSRMSDNSLPTCAEFLPSSKKRSM
jgi:hypothetical protein